MQSGDGTQLEAFCQCEVGWVGENCDQCTPAYNCPNPNDQGSGVQPCLQPNECRCEGDPENPPDIENVQRCTVWVAEGACQDDADCEAGEYCGGISAANPDGECSGSPP